MYLPDQSLPRVCRRGTYRLSSALREETARRAAEDFQNMRDKISGRFRPAQIQTDIQKRSHNSNQSSV